MEKSPNDAPVEAVRQLLDDELDHDGHPVINLASFGSAYVAGRAGALLLLDTVTEEMSDTDEYPVMMVMRSRCLSLPLSRNYNQMRRQS